MKKKLLILVSLIFFSASIMIYQGSLEKEGPLVASPDGRFLAKTTYCTFRDWIPRAPGDSLGKRGYITIYSIEGVSYGKVPVSMLSQVYDIRWGNDGARIPAHSEWNFSENEFSYWNENQSHQTTKPSRSEPVDADNPDNPPENSKNQLDD